jgi:hypothetical protein
MNPFPLNEEMRKQELAEVAERAGAAPGIDADVEAYRLVMRAAALPLAQQLPADFASRMAVAVAVEEVPSLLDRLAPSVGLALLVIVGIVTSGEYLTGALRQIAEVGSGLGGGRLPWPMLCGAVLALAAVGMSDRLLKRRW